MSSQLDLALGLARIGLEVFPWKMVGDRKQPLTERGHTDSTTDAEQISTWWLAEFPDAKVGVNMGASGLVGLDLDRKNNKDGFLSVDEAWLEIPPTFHYNTPKSGEHHIYRAPEGVRLTINGDYRGMAGVDRRAGSGWLGWHGPIPKSFDEFAAAPEWLCDPAKDQTGAAFDGALDDWLAGIEQGEPTGRVLEAMGRVPLDADFGHQTLIERQFELVRLAAEGQPGIQQALELLRSEWLRRPYDTDDNRYQFDVGLSGAIRNFGAQDAAIAGLPDYTKTLYKVTGDTEVDLLLSEGKGKANYFKVVKSLVGLELTDPEVSALVWGAPSTKAHAREWGINYLRDQIVLARRATSTALQSAPNPAGLDSTGNKVADFTLLTPEERALVADYPTFIDRYLAWVGSKNELTNDLYNRANAWTILSLVFGFVGFIPYSNKKVGVNIFQINLGGSSTGKSDAIIARDEVLDSFFAHDPGYAIGVNASPEGLHELLLTRDGLPSFLNADEAARFFKDITERKYMSTLDDMITHWYDGPVPPIHKKSSKELSGKRAMTSLSAAFYGTPDWTFPWLTREMFLSGFLSRFQWSIYDGEGDGADEVKESQADTVQAARLADPVALSFANEFHSTRALIGVGRHPVLADQDALDRMGQNRADMRLLLEGEDNWEILKSPYRRLGDVVRKAAALVALSEGSTRVTLVHTLVAIRQAEVWLTGLVKAVNRVSSSVFQREADEIASYIRGIGGMVPETRIAHRFARYEPRDFIARVSSLVMQGVVLKEEANGQHGIRYEWNRNA